MIADWIKTAQVGDKVVCVIGGVDYAGIPTGLIEGNVYTIRQIVCGLGQVGVVLEEVKSWHPCGGAWDANRFRPFVQRPTSITIFTDMLKPIKAPQHEEA